MAAGAGTGQPFDSWGSAYLPGIVQVEDTDGEFVALGDKIEGLNVGEGGFLYFTYFGLASVTDADTTILIMSAYLDGEAIAIVDSNSGLSIDVSPSAAPLEDILDPEFEDWLVVTTGSSSSFNTEGGVVRPYLGGVSQMETDVIVVGPGTHTLELRWKVTGVDTVLLADRRLQAWTMSY